MPFLNYCFAIREFVKGEKYGLKGALEWHEPLSNANQEFDFNHKGRLIINDETKCAKKIDNRWFMQESSRTRFRMCGTGEAFGFSATVSPIYPRAKQCCLGGTLCPQDIHVIENKVFALMFSAFAFIDSARLGQDC